MRTVNEKDITTDELAMILEGNGGDFHGKRLMKSLHCSGGQLRTILQWFDDNGLTIVEPRRRYISPTLSLDDVVGMLQDDFADVTFERRKSRKRHKAYRPQEKKPPYLTCIFDAEEVFEGVRITLYELKHQLEINVPLGYGTIWRHTKRDGDTFLCYAVGKRLFRVTGGYNPVELVIALVPWDGGDARMELVEV